MSKGLNLPILAEQAIERLGEQDSLFFEGEMTTNLSTMRQGRRLQRAFTDLGLKKGDIATLCMINHPTVYAVFGGGFRTGATMVPVMFALTPTELRFIFSHCETSCVITDAMLVDKVREAVEGLDHVRWIAVRGGENRPDATPREYRLEDLLEYDEQPVIADIDPEDTALILYTSGTTGRPKGVMLTHSNFMASGEAGFAAREIHLRKPPMIAINSLPMAHIFGVGVMNAGYLTPKEYAGGYMVQEVWFDPERFLQLIQEHRCTDLAAVPTMLSLILSHPKIDDYDLTSLEEVAVGAAPLPDEVAREFSERSGCRIRPLYGMTENAGMGTAGRISMPFRSGSAGIAYDNVELRIHDDDGNDLPPGESGEIVTRGPCTMKGYYKQPEETAETLRNGWLHTGDIGYLDEEGWLFVVDRKKDMIIKGGENIFPAEIENVLYAHPDIAEAAIVGVPHPTYGEEVVAFVVPRGNATLTDADVIAHVKTEVSSFKAPSRVYFRKDLPKSGIGKILRRELRDLVKELEETG